MPLNLGITTRASGEEIWQTNPPAGSIEVWRDATGYKAMVAADYFTAGGVTSPKTSVRNVFNGSRTVTADFFNIHVFDPATVGVPRDIDYAGIRIHDAKGPVTGSGMRWPNINTSAGVYSFADLFSVADLFYAAGKKLHFMSYGTPNRCAATTPGTGKYDDSTYRATNQPLTAGGLLEYADWGTQLATLFNGSTHGFIESIEDYNEQNYTGYWAGTHAQAATKCRVLRNAVRAVNAAVKIVAPTIQEPESTGGPWLTTYLAASDGAAGTGKDNLDVCGIHLYPPKYNYGLAWSQYDTVRTILDAAGLTTTEVWNTETGVLFDPQRTIPAAWKAKALKRHQALCAAKGVKRNFWYTYDNPDIAMTSAEKDAWSYVRGVLLSGPITNCNILPDETVCITVNGRDYSF